MNAETFKKTWRPAMGWALVFINLLYAVLLCGLLISGLTTFSEVMPFMLAQIGQLTVVGTVTAAGRTWEKRHGADGSTAADHGGAVS
ncbi:MAG: hypothetical protein ABJN98_12280 [Roseibium sp.]|uniref:hypothetical protein n=1 Tax=Roseibium polysiphoniae TaxID=2571221 RepID=UPI00329A6487